MSREVRHYLHRINTIFWAYTILNCAAGYIVFIDLMGENIDISHIDSGGGYSLRDKHFKSIEMLQSTK